MSKISRREDISLGELEQELGVLHRQIINSSPSDKGLEVLRQRYDQLGDEYLSRTGGRYQPPQSHWEKI